MLQAAQQRLAGIATVDFIQRDARDTLPDGPFDLVFLGGLLMYLNDADARALVARLGERLAKCGAIILRETTVTEGRQFGQGIANNGMTGQVRQRQGRIVFLVLHRKILLVDVEDGPAGTVGDGPDISCDGFKFNRAYHEFSAAMKSRAIYSAAMVRPSVQSSRAVSVRKFAMGQGTISSSSGSSPSSFSG